MDLVLSQLIVSAIELNPNNVQLIHNSLPLAVARIYSPLTSRNYIGLCQVGSSRIMPRRESLWSNLLLLLTRFIPARACLITFPIAGRLSIVLVCLLPIVPFGVAVVLRFVVVFFIILSWITTISLIIFSCTSFFFHLLGCIGISVSCMIFDFLTVFLLARLLVLPISFFVFSLSFMPCAALIDSRVIPS